MAYNYTHTGGKVVCAWHEELPPGYDTPVHERLFPHVRALEEDQVDVHLQNMLNARLYSNRDPMAFEWDEPIATSFRPLNANLENVIQQVCDTLVSRIGSNRPKATVITRGADFDVYLRGRQLNRYVWGEFEYHDVYTKIRRCFLDSLVYGTAFFKMDLDGDEIYMERVHPDEIIVDQRECVSNSRPMCMYQRKLVSRAWLKQTYGDHGGDIDECIDKAQGHNFQYTSYRTPVDEQVIIIEAVKRPTRPGAGDGKRAICIENYTFCCDPYTDDEFPYIELRFAEPENGYYGRPLVSDLMDYQIRLNELNRLIQIGQDLMCVPRILIEKGSGMLLSQFDNTIAKLLEYRGTKPEALTWEAFNAEIYAERDRIKNSAFEFAGLNQMLASGKTPNRFAADSSEAIREVSAMQDERYQDKVQAYEKFVIDIAKRDITLSARLHKNTKKNRSTFYRSGQLVQQIDWKSVNLESDKYVLQVGASSVLNMTPAARIDKLEFWRANGIINLAQYHSLSGEPDLEKLSDQLSAGTDAIEFQIDKMLKGDPATPTPLDKLQIGLPMVHDTYNRLSMLNAPPRVLVLFRQWISIAKQIMAPEPTPVMGPPPSMGMPLMPGMPGQPAGPEGMPAPEMMQMQDQSQSPSEGQMSFEEAMELALGRDPVVPEIIPSGKIESEIPVVEPESSRTVIESKPVEPVPADPSIRSLMDREAAAVSKETALREAETDIRKLRERVDAVEQKEAKFLINPAEYIRSLAPGVNLSKLAEDLWFEDLGEAAPKDYQLRKEVRGAKAEVHDLRKQQSEVAARQAEEKSRMEAETALNQYVGQLKEVIPALDDKNRLVKSLAAQNADMAIRMMLDAASFAAQEGKMLTPAQAAEAVENYLGQFSGLFAPPPAPEDKAPPSEPQGKPVPTSLRNSSVTVQTPRVPADPNDPKVLRRNALIEAGMNPDDPKIRSWLEE